MPMQLQILKHSFYVLEILKFPDIFLFSGKKNKSGDFNSHQMDR